ncbi:MAG: histone deacetylase [Cellvibrionaceae bacterium]
MSKFVRLYNHVVTLGLDKNIRQPEPGQALDFQTVHCPDYLQELAINEVDSKAWRAVGLPWSEGLVERTFTAPKGTLLTAQLAMEHGLACHLAGGTHHAHYDHGSGFCMLNDLAFAAVGMLQHPSVKKILIFDLDVHQGDGTASILSDREDIFTCSIHCEKNFPFRKSKSDLDVGLEKGIQDEEYLKVVMDALEILIEQEKPDLILYDAGVDVWEYDALGHMHVSWEGIQQRDREVIEYCLRRHIPVATVIGGGYDRDHQRLAERHGIVIETASGLFNRLG